MADYKAPLRDMRFVLNEVFNVTEQWAQLPAPVSYTHLTLPTN